VEEIDLYKVLGVEKTASKSEIKKAFHKVRLSVLRARLLVHKLRTTADDVTTRLPSHTIQIKSLKTSGKRRR
jgi:preprotein translocase subunit Sec63